MAGLDIPGAGKTDLHLVPPESMVIIGLDTKDGPEHILYDPRIKTAIDDPFVKNIAKFGVLQPVVCVRDGENLIVAAGRRRVRAARLANEILKSKGSTLIRVPVTIRRGNDADKIGVMISENENREDDEILVKAEKCKRFMDFGNSSDDAAIIFGVTRQQIQNWILLTEASGPVRKAVEQGKISATAAVKLAPLSADEQKTKLEEILKDAGDKKVSVAKVEKKLGKKKKRRKSDDDKPTAEQIQAVFDHLDSLNSKKRLTGKTEGLYDCLAWLLGKLATEEVEHLYEETADVLNPKEDEKKSA